MHYYRHNTNSRYREGEQILHVKEIVDSPIYTRHHNSPIRHIYDEEKKEIVQSQNEYQDDLGIVKNHIYTASRNNLLNSRKHHNAYQYYNGIKR